MLEPPRQSPTACSRFQDFARRRRDVFGIAVLALTLNLVGNDRTSLWDRDEPRYAGCTREMRRAAIGSFRPLTASRAFKSRS